MTDSRIELIRDLLPRAMLPDWVRLGSRLVRLLRDHHHSDRHGALLDRLVAQAEASVALRERRSALAPVAAYPPDLPITARKDDIVAAIRAHQVVVIAGETGSGKTTQIPKMCLEAGLGIEAMIGCTQPRRVAALSISRRIAEEMNVAWGGEVGCKIRFDDHSGRDTYIKLMTDGILLAETQGDPLLCEYNALIIDEAHERSLNIDFLLGYLKGLLVKRPELKLIITSATIDTEAFSRAFNNAPIIEVSGRLYPVEVVYAPLDAASEESGELTCIDAAVRAVEEALCEPGGGDVLVFMPGERDIRETSDQIESRFGRETEVIPLFGRLSSGEQQRVFAPAARRKIVVATNIAETSLTIPGIRYVIDSGLARVSRYNARTRTRRLPVEPVSQSSANQRKGRAGRVRDGVCIRLFSEEDFAGRPPYTQPEIQRSNLAEVILRMKAFRLGEIETFPFLNPPAPAAIQGGYLLLQELGALDEARQLTPLGCELARLPIDPTLGRMLLQSEREGAARELLIIASGLSIQDPRDRPLDQKDAAAAAHKRFSDPQSDFLTLLNIWNAVHEEWENLRTQNQRRKFCRAHFLSYTRMREWQDLYAQLEDALSETAASRKGPGGGENGVPLPVASEPKARRAAPDLRREAVHRSILSGLLGHVAARVERNQYKTAGSRKVAVFPGSALFERGEKPRESGRAKGPPKPVAPAQPPWIMAGEIVETSQLFIRTIAGIDPLWIVELAPHLCKVAYQNPHWAATAGQVLAEEKTTLYGMEVRGRKVAYGNINPKEATAIFIRSALVEENLFPSDDDEEADPGGSPREHGARGRAEARGACAALAAHQTALAGRKSVLPGFIEHNRRVRQKIETWQTRVRRHDLGDLDQALFDFYSRHIESVSSVHELNRLLGEKGEPGFLRATEADLVGGHALEYDAEAFPDTVSLGGQPVPLSYSYQPGEEDDGVTVKLGFALAQSISAASVEWAVPGLREGQIGELLRALPKAIRRELMPFPPKVAEIARELRPTGSSLKHDLAQFIRRRYGIEIPPSAWPAEALPAHLQPRVEIVGNDQQPIGASRNLVELRRQLEQAKVAEPPAGDPPAWLQAARQWERFGLTGWTIGTLPERLPVDETGKTPLYAWPGLKIEEGAINLRLFRAQEAARRASLPAIRRLVELEIQRDLGWIQKDLRAMAGFAAMLTERESIEELQASAFENLKGHLLPAEPFPSLAEDRYRAAVAEARRRLPGLATRLLERVGSILTLRQEFLRRWGPRPAPVAAPLRSLSELQLRLPAARPASVAAKSHTAGQGSALAGALQAELDLLAPARFLETVPFERLPHLPRYLKALAIRAERASLNPLKDQERARQLVPYREALRRLASAPEHSEAVRRLIEEYRWMIEEFKVSVFAQELGTAFPISAKRLDQQLERIAAA